MNSYNDNLQLTSAESLAQLQNQQSTLNSSQTSAQYQLYFAQGAQITAQDNHETAVTAYNSALKIDHQGVDNNNLATNLLATATSSKTNTATLVTNAATAANNIQVASNMIAKVNADIGAAFNLVSAADLGTDIYRLTKQANQFINQTSVNAKKISQLAMDASTFSAEMISSVVETEATAAKAQVESLLNVASSEFTKLATKRTTTNNAISTTSKAEKLAEGVLKDANQQVSAINTAYQKSNQQLNYGLEVTPQSSTQFTVSYEEKVDSFAYLANSFEPSMSCSTTKEVQGYYVTVVKASKSSLFTLDQAETNFNEFQQQRFVNVSSGTDPVDGKPVITTVDTQLLKDSDGDAINAGDEYVVFLYLELTPEYKKQVDNYADLFSAATNIFTLTESLLLPTSTLTLANNVISFDVEGDVHKGTEYRCIFLPASLPGIDVFMVNPSLLLTKDEAKSTTQKAAKVKPSQLEPIEHHLGFYFSLNIAQLVSPANYTVADINGCTISSTADKDSIRTTHYQVKIASETTDNFGNEIIEGDTYFAVILAVMDDDSSSGQYTAQMTKPDGQTFVLTQDV